MSESPDASALNISEDFAPTNPPKLAGQTTLTFSGRLSPPLILHEDLKESCGGQAWPAGILLGRFLLSRRHELRGKRVIELGAGGGLVGLALALGLLQQGAKIDSSQPPILITDLPILIPLQRKNIALNSLPASSVISEPLPWGSSIPNNIPPEYRQPDVILAADCVYFEPAFPLLLETLRSLMGVGRGPDSRLDPGPVCWFCMKKRRKADMRFIKSLKKTFAVTEVDSERKEDENRTFLCASLGLPLL